MLILPWSIQIFHVKAGRSLRAGLVEVTELILYKQKKINRHLIPLNTHTTSSLTLPSDGSELSSFWGCICAVFHTHAGKKTLVENRTSERWLSFSSLESRVTEFKRCWNPLGNYIKNTLVRNFKSYLQIPILSCQAKDLLLDIPWRLNKSSLHK